MVRDKWFHVIDYTKKDSLDIHRDVQWNFNKNAEELFN